ncbi:MAG: hypothetical protein KBD28_12635, partial [Chitinophagaceae bacterium]|nr:hypothetical protein [Chitinophagaceae bacterium]
MKKIIFSIASVFVATVLFAQPKPAATKTTAPVKLDRSKRPAPAPAPAIKMGEMQSFELPNGLKVFVVENHKT